MSNKYFYSIKKIFFKYLFNTKQKARVFLGHTGFYGN